MARAGKIRTGVALGLVVLGGFVVVCGPRILERPRGGAAGATPATGRDTHSADEWYARGNDLLHDSKDLHGAVEAYRKAVDLAPAMAEAHYGIGYALLQLGDAEGAAAELESALSLAPADASWRQDAENALVLAHLRKAQAQR